MKHTVALPLLLSAFLSSCATAPLMTTDAVFIAPVPFDKAFDAAMAAGTDLGFVPLKGPPPDKDKGSVWFQVGGSSAGEVTKRVVLASAMFTHEYILQVYLRRDGVRATGVDLKANRTGVGEFTKEQADALQAIFTTYKDALKARLQQSAND